MPFVKRTKELDLKAMMDLKVISDMAESEMLWLAVGTRGGAVSSIQRLMPGLKVDGHYGTKTERAVRAFQRQVSQREDGIVGYVALLW